MNVICQSLVNLLKRWALFQIHGSGDWVKRSRLKRSVANLSRRFPMPSDCGGRTEKPGAFAPGGGNPTPGRSCWRPLHGCGFATKRAGEQDEGVCRKVQFQAVGAFGMAAHLWRRCQHAPAPQVEGEAEESDIGCVAQARKGARANKTIAAFHRAEQASMAGGSRRRYDCEPPSEIASASAAHQSVGSRVL
jgi:hypothetical protein